MSDDGHCGTKSFANCCKPEAHKLAHSAPVHRIASVEPKLGWAVAVTNGVVMSRIHCFPSIFACTRTMRQTQSPPSALSGRGSS